MRLQYLQTPRYSRGEGIGDGVSALGKSIASLGTIADDREKRKRDIKKEQFNMKLLEDEANKKQEQYEYKKSQRGVTEKSKQLDNDIKQYTLKSNQEKDEYSKKRRKTEERKDNLTIQKDEIAVAEAKEDIQQRGKKKVARVSAFKKMYPDATKGLTDDEIYALGESIDKLIPNNTALKKVDVFTNTEDERIITFTDEKGNITQRNLGNAKDYGKPKNKETDRKGWISVGKDFYEQYAHTGFVKTDKKRGGFYSPIDFVNKMQQRQIGKGEEQLNAPLR